MLRVSANKAATLVDDGYRTIESLLYWKYDDILKWKYAKSKMPVIQGGRTFSQLLTKRLQGLAWWANDLNLREQTLDMATFNTAARVDLIDEVLLDHEERENPDESHPSLKTIVGLHGSNLYITISVVLRTQRTNAVCYI